MRNKIETLSYRIQLLPILEQSLYGYLRNRKCEHHLWFITIHVSLSCCLCFRHFLCCCLPLLIVSLFVCVCVGGGGEEEMSLFFPGLHVIWPKPIRTCLRCSDMWSGPSQSEHSSDAARKRGDDVISYDEKNSWHFLELPLEHRVPLWWLIMEIKLTEVSDAFKLRKATSSTSSTGEHFHRGTDHERSDIIDGS